VLFGLSNVLLFAIIIFFLVMTGRQQRRLQQLSCHLEELLREMRTDAPHVAHPQAPPPAGPMGGGLTPGPAGGEPRQK